MADDLHFARVKAEAAAMVEGVRMMADINRIEPDSRLSAYTSLLAMEITAARIGSQDRVDVMQALGRVRAMLLGVLEAPLEEVGRTLECHADEVDGKPVTRA